MVKFRHLIKERVRNHKREGEKDYEEKSVGNVNGNLYTGSRYERERKC